MGFPGAGEYLFGDFWLTLFSFCSVWEILSFLVSFPSISRVEGDDPTGACVVPYDRNDPNLETTLDIEEELYCAWPEVVVSTEKKRAFSMYYSTMLKDSKQKCISCAQSTDGFRWEKEGLCLSPDEEGLDAGGCARCNVVRDATWDGTNWRELDTWTMYCKCIVMIDLLVL